MVIEGETLALEAIQSLLRYIQSGSSTTANARGSYRSVDINAQYMARIVGDVNLKRKMKIVLDCGNGSPAVVAQPLFEALGCEVIPLFCDVDGTFPNHHPDPSQPKKFTGRAARIERIRR